LIKENKIDQLKSVIQTGAKDGMVTMENSIAELLKEKWISDDTAGKRVGRQKKV
jgi:Tfp pilus assembly pilus retraction ATPase PilT